MVSAFFLPGGVLMLLHSSNGVRQRLQHSAELSGCGLLGTSSLSNERLIKNTKFLSTAFSFDIFSHLLGVRAGSHESSESSNVASQLFTQAAKLTQVLLHQVIISLNGRSYLKRKQK